MTKEEFLIKAREIHGYKYDYSLVPDTIKTTDKIDIICNTSDEANVVHGKFTIAVNKHLYYNRGCPKCSKRYKKTKEDFVREATLVHNGLYTYDSFKWVNTKTKGTIHCTKHNIDFEMTPEHHLKGQGCPKCRYEKVSASKTKTVEDFKQSAKNIHGNRYDYSKVEYRKNNEKVCIICPKHGEFWITPNNHTHKTNPQGCPQCAIERNSKERTLSNEMFIEKANNIHSHKYDYSLTNYINSVANVRIICPQHGEFSQIARNHLYGQGCPKCGCFRSKGEKEVENFIKELGFEITTSNRKIIDNGEIDIYVNDKKIAIEYNGLYWHSDLYKSPNYHYDKLIKCQEKGIRLINIFEDEWLEKKDIVKSRIRNILNLSDKRIFARKCKIKEVNSSVASSFLEKNHIQGRCNATYNIGLFYDDEMVSLMTFGKNRFLKKQSSNTFEMLRFCNKLNMSVVGGAGKLLNYFIKKYSPDEITSYADRRWSNGNLYEKLGFNKYNESKPNYFYVVNGRRYHRYTFRKSELVKEGFDSNKTEKTIMEERGIPRIYDCGCLCYKLKIANI